MHRRILILGRFGHGLGLRRRRGRRQPTVLHLQPPRATENRERIEITESLVRCGHCYRLDPSFSPG